MTEPSKSPSKGRRSEALLGPFTIRELTLFLGVVITFVASLLPLFDRFLFANLWNASNLFFLSVGILGPLASAALFAWRGLSPAQRLRVGSLSVDQFASVTAVLSAAFYFVLTVTTLSPGAFVGLLGGFAMIGATTVARFIPPFAVDFDGRANVPAHPMARDAVPALRRPKARGVSSPAGRPHDSEAPAVDAAGPTAPGGQRGPDRPPLGAPQNGPGGRPVATGQGGGATRAPHEAAAAGSAAAAGAALAWAGADDGVWSPAPGGATEHPGAPVNGTTPASDDSRSAASPADGTTHADEDRSSEAAAASGPFGTLGTPHARDGAALEATEAHLASQTVAGQDSPFPSDALGPDATDSTRPGEAERQNGVPGAGAPTQEAAYESAGSRDHFGDADGEAYGAPEPVSPVVASPKVERPAAEGKAEARSEDERPAEARPLEAPLAEQPPSAGSPGPATAVFPASSRGPQPAAPSAAHEDIGATRPYEEPQPYEAFWFAVSERRTAVDSQTGRPLFDLQPGQWILALQDRGSEFVVQSTDGRVGILRELAGIERG
ncbi:hypothetical protein GCM10012320_21740 [Sinomonas cellulolyticus]|uniref:Uncharacterized protein n=1 Tax=Sinomonas cellulolyticus TaxID=2801916 RepID=A0ABS1K2I0_9MICC|nr:MULTISPECIES: hypothetical protein [Sinomonas]MBL0705683.1 hypothetical protein [Sinomonas cellulolyticus]GHG51925.1 hypothetical protein GCM10012320_21740 [Sinomonas sp. KCTC 49339]